MNKSYVTMEQKLCPICGNKQDSGALLLDRKLRDKFETKTTTGYGLCKPCQKKSDDGFIALVVCDPTKSTPEGNILKLENAYRTGEIIHIKKKVYDDLFNQPAHKGMVFIDSELAIKLKEMVK